MKVQVRVRREALSGVRDAREAIERLSQEYAIGARGTVGAAEVAASALAREAAGSTYIGRGLAIPHARLQGLPEAGVYVAQSDEGIPWADEPAQLIILLVVPAEMPELYLQILSRLVRWRMKGGEVASLSQAISCGLDGVCVQEG